MSAVGLSNDNYKGGEFVICGEELKLKAGSLLIFPSNYVYPHSVKPVISGTRYSFVSWAW
jgi:predicted 2-oxoglutarate/Fe(II)-dependent dioxygenase YbiX